MKKFKRTSLIFLSLLIIFSLTIGCNSKEDLDGSHNISPQYSSMSNQNMTKDIDDSSESSSKRSNLDSQNIEPEKLITTISIYLETTEFNQSNNNLKSIIEKYNAYIENSDISHHQGNNKKILKRGNFSIRIPEENLNDFQTEINNIGNIISESTNKEDITKQYRDTESRLKIIETKEDRILSLLEKAEKVEDIISLEEQLSQTIIEKEELKRNLLYIDDQIDFSTINIHIQEVEHLNDPETLETNFKTRIINAMKNSAFKFKQTIENIFIGIIYLLPFLLVFTILLFIGYKIYKRFFNRKNRS